MAPARRRVRFVFSLAGLALAGCVRYRPEPLDPAATATTLDERSLEDSGLRAFVLRNLGDTTPARPDTILSWDLTRLTLAAFYYSPDLDVARATYGVARAGLVTAGERPNPTLSAVPARTVSETERASVIEQGITPWSLSLSLDLPLELFHKRGYRIARARHAADSTLLGIAQTAWDIRDRVRGAWLDLDAARARITVQRSLVAQREELVALLERRLAVGEASQLDVSRERALRDQARLSLRGESRTAAEALAGLASAVTIPAESLQRAPIDTMPDETAASVALPAVDSLRRLALLGRADVLAAIAGYQADESALALEVARQYPDLHLLPGLDWDRGEERISFGPSVVLPVLNQNRGPILEAFARRREAASRVMQIQTRVLGQLDSALAAYRGAAVEVIAADSLLAAQQRTTAGVEAQFRAGEVDRVALVSTQIEGSAIRLTRLDALAAERRALGRVEDAIQRPLIGGPVPAAQQTEPPR